MTFSKADQAKKPSKKRVDRTEYDKAAQAFTHAEGYISCAWCGKSVGAPAYHHVIPRSRGGPTHHANIAPVHPACHDAIHAAGTPGWDAFYYDPFEGEA